jgi:hypothetical protein
MDGVFGRFPRMIAAELRHQSARAMPQCSIVKHLDNVNRALKASAFPRRASTMRDVRSIVSSSIRIGSGPSEITSG